MAHARTFASVLRTRRLGRRGGHAGRPRRLSRRGRDANPRGRRRPPGRPPAGTGGRPTRPTPGPRRAHSGKVIGRVQRRRPLAVAFEQRVGPRPCRLGGGVDGGDGCARPRPRPGHADEVVTRSTLIARVTPSVIQSHRSSIASRPSIPRPIRSIGDPRIRESYESKELRKFDAIADQSRFPVCPVSTVATVGQAAPVGGHSGRRFRASHGQSRGRLAMDAPADAATDRTVMDQTGGRRATHNGRRSPAGWIR